jgi:ABC-type multidrug transport system permease subunit
MFSSSPLAQLYFTRLRDFYRQPARIFWVYAFPTILAIVLGFAFQNRLPEPIAVDLIESANSASIEQAINAHNQAVELARKSSSASSASTDLPAVLLQKSDTATATRRLNTGKTPIVIVADSPTTWTYRFDRTRPEASSARLILDDILQRAAGRKNPRQTHDEFVTEPGSRYIDFLIPGLIGLNTMGGGLWGVGFMLVNFRIAKLLKRFVATPMPRRDFLFAILGARLTFLVPDLAVLLSLGVFMFQMPIRGGLIPVIIVDVVGALAFAGIGLLVASRANSTETVSGLMNAVMVPMWLCSGVFFSSERFPALVQPLIQALPLTQLVSALRRVMLEGATLIDVGPSILIMAIWAVVSFLIALRIFRWT